MANLNVPEPKVCVVILNWNNAADTIVCLASLARISYTNFDVIVVDNGSTDQSVAEIKLEHPDVKILQMAHNLGFSAGNNAGIQHAMKSGADFVLILNNDTWVDPDMLRYLVAAAAQDPRVGMVGPVVYCAEPSDKLFAAGSFIEWAQGRTWHRGMFEPAEGHINGDAPETVDFVSGCCVLVRREVIEAVGGLDLGYFLNYEDVEWAVRARRIGYEVLYVPKAIMWHKVSSTLGQASPANTYYMTRNALRFFWGNATGLLRWLAVASILYRTARTVGAWSILPKYQGLEYRKKRRANLHAVRDFILGKVGQMESDGMAKLA